MSAPINTRHRSSHFFESVRGGGPPVSTAFPKQTDENMRRPQAGACFRRRPEADAPFV